MPESLVCNADLWAACIGGAAQRDAYVASIEGAGPTKKYGVKSVSIVAVEQ